VPGALERIVRSGAAYQAAAILSAALAFATYHAYTAAVGLPLLGLADLVLAWLILLSIVARLGFGEALLRHWYTATDADRPQLQRTIQRTVFLTSGVIAIVVLVLAPQIAPVFSLHGRTADPWIVRIAAAGVFFYCNLDIAQTLLRARDDRRTYLIESLSNVLLTVTATVVLVVIFDGGVRGYLIGNYAASAVVLSWLWWRERGVLLGRVTSEPVSADDVSRVGGGAVAAADGVGGSGSGSVSSSAASYTQAPAELTGAVPGDASAQPSSGVLLESEEELRGASRGELRPLLRFGLPLVPTDAAIFAFNLFDRTILRIAVPGSGAYAGYALGVFSGASKIAAGVILVARAFQLAFPPLAYGIKDAKAAAVVYASALRGYAVVMGGTVAGVALCAPWTVQLLISTTDGFADPRPEVIEILPLLTVAWALWGVVPVMTTIAGRLGATRLTVPAAVVGLAVNLIALVVLVPPYGAKGAAIALVTAYLVLIGTLHLLTRRHFPVAFDIPRMSIAVITCVAAASLGGPLADASSLGWGPAAIRLVIFSVMIVVLWNFALKQAERSELVTVARRLARRRG
jgi:O-antigen/teichoic acid export membrane protein